MASITSANSTFALAITNLYPSPQIIQGYAADDAFALEAIDLAETIMGIDGFLSAGYVHNPVPMTITLMPDSPSVVIFDTWISTTQTTKEVYRCSASILLPGTGKKYTLQNGVLVNGKIMPDAKKTLQSMPYRIMWQAVFAEPN